jgi:hypothetical protein
VPHNAAFSMAVRNLLSKRAKDCPELSVVQVEGEVAVARRAAPSDM